jgi:hypothetical protein
VLAEAGLGPMSAQLNQAKEIDAGIWVVGKRARDWWRQYKLKKTTPSNRHHMAPDRAESVDANRRVNAFRLRSAPRHGVGVRLRQRSGAERAAASTDRPD